MDWHTFAPVIHRRVMVTGNGSVGGVPNVPCNLADAFERKQRAAVQSFNLEPSPPLSYRET